MRAVEFHRIERAAAFLVVVCVLCTAGCSNDAPRGAISPGISGTADTIVAYPPLPRPPAGSPQGCLGVPNVGLTPTAADRIVGEATSIVGPDLESIAPCSPGPVWLGLRAGTETTAKRVWLRFGRDVYITVGLTVYRGSPGRSPRCGILQKSSLQPSGLHLSVVPKSIRVTSGGTFDANVEVTDDGPGTFDMDTGQPLQAVIIHPGSAQVVGVLTENVGGTGFEVHAGPGQTKKIPVLGGTSRCDGGVGSGLPPGSYDSVVRVAPEGQPQNPVYFTPPIRITVTP